MTHREHKGQALGNTRTRAFCMTINNWTQDEYDHLKRWCLARQNLKWIIGKEEGKSGTHHLQVYFYSKNPISWKTIKNQFPRAHIEKANGSLEQNYAYCKKEEDFETNMDM